ncbi:MAG: hypothetical protein ACFB11_07905 [Paracoccaceae bacterium]
MTDLSPELIADAVVSLTSLIGLALFGQVLRLEQPRPTVTRRFLFAIQIVAAIMAARLLQWMTGWQEIGRLTFVFASLVPLASLLVAEALLRRHAPPILKLLAAGGALTLSFVGLLASRDYALAALISLAVFQTLMFIALGALILSRDRGSLSPAENTTIDRLALSLILILPLALADFRTEIFDIPVRPSGIAILVLCWLGLTLRRSGTGQADLLSSVAASAASLLVAAFCIAALANLDTRTTIQVMAVTLSLGLLALVHTHARRTRREDSAGLLLDVLADANRHDHSTFLTALQTRALTSGALILDKSSLGDFDTSFEEQFAHAPIMSSTDLHKLQTPPLIEQFEWFFRKFDASHAMLVSTTPFRIMVLKIPMLARSEQLEQELKIAQRMAIMLASRNAPDA